MKILVADDARVSRRLLEVTLAHEGYEVVLATDGGEAMRILEQKDSPRLAILDWIMPQVDGIEVCRAIRKQAREPYVYVILLSAKGEQSEIIEGLEAGADDYIIKPFDLSELKARLRAGRRILELEQQLLSARELLRLQATHDGLTGLLNRSAILDALQREVARAAREKEPVSIISLDLDHFKSVNDTYGHQAGDAVLVETAQRIKGSLRVYDSVGRCGGEEFLICCPGCDEPTATELARRVLENVSTEPMHCNYGTISVTASLGVATISDGFAEVDHLIRSVDQALYAAKINGRNGVVASSCLLHGILLER